MHRFCPMSSPNRQQGQSKSQSKSQSTYSQQQPQSPSQTPKSQTQSQPVGDATGAPKVPRRLLRRLSRLEQQMRAFLPNFRRVPQIETLNQVNYFIKLLETFLNANSGSLRDQAMRQLILKKLWIEYYIW